MSFFNELKRRNVFRVAAAYIVVSWLILQVTDVVLNNIGAPGWVFRVILLLLGIGLPVILLFAWAFELTPEGLKREREVDRSQSITPNTGKNLDRVIIGVLVLALGYFAYDKFVLSGARDAALVEATTQAISELPAAGPEASAELDKSIAVLPFVNMSSDQEQEYFSDGLSEELLNLLAKIPELRVIARTSSFAYKGKDVQIEDVARELKVAHVLEGSVRKAGNQVRITAQLIRANDSSHLWSDTFDRSLDNVFAIQDEIAGEVVNQLKVKLLHVPPTVQVTDPKAYPLYLHARQLGRQNSPESLEQSNALYLEALAIDPGYAAAWDGLSLNYGQQAVVGLLPNNEGQRLSREAANKALAIDPDFAMAYANLAHNAISSQRDLAAGARHLERALELEPGNTEILRTAATMYRTLGRLDQAIALAEYVITLDPVNTNNHYTLGLMNRYAGNLDAAIAAFQTSLSLSPGRIGAQYGIAEALMLKGEPEAALAANQKEESLWREIALPLIHYKLGQTVDSDAALADLIEQYEQDAAYNIAYIVAFRGDVDGAFEWLDKAVQYNDPGLGDLPIEDLFANIHDDPRWLPMLESVGKSPQQLDAVEFEVKLPE